MTPTERKAIIALLCVYLERVNNKHYLFDRQALVSMCAAYVLTTQQAADITKDERLQFELLQAAINFN